MSKQPKARSLTTEQLVEQAIQQVQQMSEAEKAKLREHLSGLTDAARWVAAEEAATQTKQADERLDSTREPSFPRARVIQDMVEEQVRLRTQAS